MYLQIETLIPPLRNGRIALTNNFVIKYCNFQSHPLINNIMVLYGKWRFVDAKTPFLAKRISRYIACNKPALIPVLFSLYFNNDINLINTHIDIQSFQQVTKLNLPFDLINFYFRSIIELKYPHYIQIFTDSFKLRGSRQNVDAAFFIPIIFTQQFILPP